MTDIAYLAGFFDGEGCIYILKAKKAWGFAYDLEISFTNSDPEPLLLAQAAFGGTISVSKDTREGRKNVSRLRLRSRKASNALREMLPYLRTKKARAVMAIDFQDARAAGRRTWAVEDIERVRDAITAQNDKIWNRQTA